MNKRNFKLNVILSLVLILTLVTNIIPVSALTIPSIVTIKETQEITDNDINANEYETYYYSDNIEYSYKGHTVQFISESEIKAGDELLTLKNKKVNLNKTVEGNNVTIGFESLSIPVSMVSGQWNSSWGGDYKIVYKSDIPGQEEVKSNSLNIKSLTISNLEPGEYHLTEGTIYEEANMYSPGIPEIGTSGYFGTLPNITIVVEKSTESKNTVSISVEKRVIGKGDTISLEEVSITDGDTAWDVLKKVADEKGIDIEYSGSGSNVYVSSIDGDGEFDHGNQSGWKYEVNGVFPDVSLGAYKLENGDVIRLRYCLTIGSEELKNPLVYYLNDLFMSANELLYSGEYTEESMSALDSVLFEAIWMINDEKYHTTETEVELEVSALINKINLAIDALVKISDTPEVPDESITNVPDDFENDLWLQYDFKEMKIGDTADIYPRRIPQIVGSSVENDVFRPNFNFEIVSGDSISLSTEDSNEKSIVTAVKEGTTIVKVTYDATEYKGKIYGASSVVNTAYVVFTVQNNDTNMEITTDIKEDSYDTIYFTEGDSTDLEFAVNANNAEKVVVTVNGEVIAKNSNNKYTAALKNKSNIIGVVATNASGETKSYYKVVDARKIEVNITNKSNPGKEIVSGDIVKISFKGITNPIAKLATIYNPTWYSESYGSKGTFVEYTNDILGTVKGYCEQWDLATNNTIEVVFDKAGTYNFDGGSIFSQWWGSSLGDDKTVQGQGNPNLAAQTHERYFSKMPSFTVNVKEREENEIKITNISILPAAVEMREGNSRKVAVEISPSNATNKTLTWTSSDEAKATVTEDGTIKAISSGKVTITATSADGKVKGECIVTVISQEYTSLKNDIKNAELLLESNYDKENWDVFKRKLEEVKLVLNNEASTKEELIKANEELKIAKKALINSKWSVAVSPEKITPGTEVTVTFNNMEIPNLDGKKVSSIATYYSFNMAGMDQLTSENGANNLELIKTIKFKIPETAKLGTYTMTDGYVFDIYTTAIGGGSELHYANEMPEIDIVVESEVQEPEEPTTPEEPSINVEDGIVSAESWILETVKNPGYQDEWKVLGLARGNLEVSKEYYETYYNNLVEVVKEKQGNLSRNKYSEYSRVIITLTALGYDPTNVGGYNLVEKLYNFNNVSKQGINGVIFALIALDTKNFEIIGSENSREKMVNYILENQLEDGGFALSGNKSEVDITAMAIQALASYKEDSKVKEAIDKALEYLSNSQYETAGFGYDSTGETVESSAQVLLAINSLGISATDSRFVKNGKTVVDAINSFIHEDGGFKHLLNDTEANDMATEQALYALISQERLMEGKTSLYDMSDVSDNVPVEPETPEVPEQPENPELPVVPEVPETPEIPEVPETPETPETPDNSEDVETPEVPGQSQDKVEDNSTSNDNNLPQTGAMVTPVMIIICALLVIGAGIRVSKKSVK